MALRIAILGFYHETNTFSVARTGITAFHDYQFVCGPELFARYRGTGTELGGIIDAAEDFGLELVPLFFAAAVPSGMITAECFDQLTHMAVEGLDGAGPLDGVLTVLHGAASAEGAPDADGALLRIVRDRLGPAGLLVATTDFHANISAAMVDSADAIIGYDTYPHTDMAERGAEAVAVLSRLCTEGRLHRAHVKLPLLTAPQCQSTDDEPMRSVLVDLHRAEARPGVVTASIAMGFPYADSSDIGASVLVYGTDRQATDRAANDLARTIWSRREDFEPALVPTSAISRLVSESDRLPMVLVDPADNVGGGSAGDGTTILAELLAARAQGAVVVICDPDAAAAAAAIGPGGQFEGLVGGRIDTKHGAPVPVIGTVTYAQDTSFRHSGSYMTGFLTRMGLTAIVDADGVRIVLTSLRTMPFDIEQLRSVGIEPAQERILVVKAAIAWRAAYGPLAGSVYTVDAPGICPSNLGRLTYTHRPAPMYPLERHATYREGAAA